MFFQKKRKNAKNEEVAFISQNTVFREGRHVQKNERRAEKMHCFFHQSDDVTLTSRGFIWTFPKKKLVEGSYCVMPEYGYEGDIDKCAGICSDFIEAYK